MSNRHVAALLFDFGNVLVNVHFERTFAAWAAATGTDADVLRARFQFDDLYAAHERGEIGAGAYCRHIRRMLDVDIPDEMLLAGWNALIGEPLEGMRELVASLSGKLPLYVFSNTNSVHYAHWGPLFTDLLQPFSRVFCSHELGVRKPDAAAFERVAQEMRVPVNRIAFFDDFEPNVLGARSVGLKAFHVAGAADVAAGLAALGLGSD
jgi:HAD superfamily hydrolase (TIGR01509 family)